MITLEKIEHEIAQTMEEPMSLHSIEKRNALYRVKRNLNGYAARRGRLSREEALEPAEWYAILNAMHADYFNVAKMFGVDNIDFYAAMAKAWLCDEDAVEDKARQYWEHVAKH